MAARTIQELKTLEEMLKRRNLEVEMALTAKKREEKEGTKAIRVSLANPSSGINSMLAVLNVLKTVGANAKAIQATFFDSQFSAQFAIDTHVREFTLAMCLIVSYFVRCTKKNQEVKL